MRKDLFDGMPAIDGEPVFDLISLQHVGDNIPAPNDGNTILPSEALTNLLDEIMQGAGVDESLAFVALLLEACMGPEFFIKKYNLEDPNLVATIQNIVLGATPPPGLEFLTEAHLAFKGVLQSFQSYVQLARSGGLKERDTTQAGLGEVINESDPL